MRMRAACGSVRASVRARARDNVSECVDVRVDKHVVHRAGDGQVRAFVCACVLSRREPSPDPGFFSPISFLQDRPHLIHYWQIALRAVACNSSSGSGSGQQ